MLAKTDIKYITPFLILAVFFLVDAGGYHAGQFALPQHGPMPHYSITAP